MTDPNIHSIDVADYQPRDLGPLIQAYQAKHVVVHLYVPGEGQGPQYSKDQINSTRDNGASAGGYVFPYRPSDDPELLLINTLTLCASVNLELPVAWVDAEPSPYGPGPDEAWFDHWFDLCDSVQMLSGPYCNPDWLHTYPWMEKYGRDGRPLWLAHHGVPADLTIYPVPDGWLELAGLQWEVAPDTGLGRVDRDVFREEFTVYSGSQPPPDPCESLRIENARLVAGIDEAIGMLTALKGGS